MLARLRDKVARIQFQCRYILASLPQESEKLRRRMEWHRPFSTHLIGYFDILLARVPGQIYPGIGMNEWIIVIQYNVMTEHGESVRLISCISQNPNSTNWTIKIIWSDKWRTKRATGEAWNSTRHSMHCVRRWDISISRNLTDALYANCVITDGKMVHICASIYDTHHAIVDGVLYDGGNVRPLTKIISHFHTVSCILNAVWQNNVYNNRICNNYNNDLVRAEPPVVVVVFIVAVDRCNSIEAKHIVFLCRPRSAAVSECADLSSSIRHGILRNGCQ